MDGGAWSWNPVVVVDGAVAGTQELAGHHFAVRRVVTSGSWLGRSFQGQGIGAEMRAAVLHLAFAGLGAVRAETDAYDDNPASLAVTRKLGYTPNGETVLAVEGKARPRAALRASRDHWALSPRSDIEIVGLAPCLPHFGAGPDGTES